MSAQKQAAPATPLPVVRRQTEFKSRNFGVYLRGELIEGGFFSRDAAEDCARALLRQIEGAE